MKFKLNMYKLKEGREMKAETFSKLVATSLYEKRYTPSIIWLTPFAFRFGPYFVAPVIAGLDKISETEYKPVICTYDSIGYREHSGQFEVAGTGGELLYGVCETFFKPDLGPEELFEVISNSLLAAMDRDSLSGWGARVYILTPTELIVRTLKTRQD
jgi:20S proteasome subunit beta 3